ncbi:MAG: HEAT repeat domain-containing protein [Candidatus Hermodarchaeota archaeon]
MQSPNKLLKDINKIGKKETIKRLHNLYSAADKKNIRIRILEILNQLQDESHFEEIENYFISDEDPDVRIEAAKLLAFNYNKKKGKAIKPLIWVLENEKKPEIRNMALQLLVPLANQNDYREEIIESLKKILKNNDDFLKMEAVQALGFLKDKSAIDNLLDLLKSSKRQIKIRTIQALGEFKNVLPVNKLKPLLIENLGENSYDVWKFSFDLLKKILDKNVLILNFLKELEDTENSNNIEKIGYLRQGIIRALGELGDKRAIPIIINALKDWYYWVNEEAIVALDKIEPKWKSKYRSELKKKHIRF